MKSILSLGELLIDLIPTTSIRLGEACYTPHAGGAVANVAVAIARLGGSSRFLGGVSDDVFGELLVQALVTNSVDTRYIHVVQGVPTALALVVLQADGQRHFTFFRQGTADSQLRTEDLNRSAWDGVAVCHVGGVLLSSEPARAATLAAIEYTRQVGAIVSFDVNIRLTLWAVPGAVKDIILQVVERADIIKLSVEEVEFLIELPDHPAEDSRGNWLEMAGDALLKMGPRLVIITLGSRGALLLTARHRVAVPALAVRALDTTGAGDAFMGAILHMLIQHGHDTAADLSTLAEQELSRLGSFANQVAGLSCTRYGGIASFPFMHEVSGFSAT